MSASNKRLLTALLNRLSGSTDPTLRVYFEVADQVRHPKTFKGFKVRRGPYGASREEVIYVDTAPLKELARKKLPETSPLRKLIETQKDRIPLDEWDVKMGMFADLLDSTLGP